MRILELDCKVEAKPFGVTVEFNGGFGSKVSEIITEEENDKLHEYVKEITNIVGEAINREVSKLEAEASKEAMNMKREDLPPELQEMLNKAEKEFKELKTPEEKVKFMIDMITETMKQKKK